jgi:hypothetical protein
MSQPFKNTQLDNQALSDFIYDLNIARRQLALYPEEHPQLQQSHARVLQVLAKLCQVSDVVTLGIAPETLMYEQQWLDADNPVYRDFAHFLSARDIASISFHRALDIAELIRFNQLLKRDPQGIAEEGGLALLLKQQQIHHISLIPVDFAAFQPTAPAAPSGADDADLWEAFLQGLTTNQLDPEGSAKSREEGLSLGQVATLLNQTDGRSPAAKAAYEQAIGSFIGTMQNHSRTQRKKISSQLAALVEQLNPEVKRSFLNSAFRALDQHVDESAELLQALPPQLLTEALQQYNRTQLNISSRLVDLLGQFASAAGSATEHRVSGNPEALPDEVQQARVDILLLEDNLSEYLPSDYQQALAEILTGKIRGNLPPSVAQQLRLRLEEHSLEKQCGAIIFNMLENQVPKETELQLQDNLSELARFFLDTGDFIALTDIYRNWSRHLYSEKAAVRFLDEKVLADQTRELFMNEVLDSIELWDTGKWASISTYIREVGEPYAELLVQRLAAEAQAERRRLWMKLLIELGDKAHQIIHQHLQDKNWQLVRNLLIVIDRQQATLPAKTLQRLTTHPHCRVRQECLRIMFRINPATANRLLQKELSSGNRDSLIAAAQLAELSRDGKLLEQLHYLLQLEMKCDADLELKQQLLRSLANCGQPATVPVLARLLQQKGQRRRSRRDQEFQKAIIGILGAFPLHTVEPLLKTLAAGRDQAQRSLAEQQLNRFKSAGESQ